MIKKLKVRRNRHYAAPGFPIPIPVRVDNAVPTYMSGAFKFTESCLYEFHDEDQFDFNKLFGFSIGYHHNNSFRFAWRPNDLIDKIEVATYSYINGERTQSIPLLEAEPNKWYYYTIYYDPIELKVYYTVNDITVTEDVSQLNKTSGWGYTTRLYFGGNKRAPHKIIIYKKRKNLLY
jgi:hypothetical protein